MGEFKRLDMIHCPKTAGATLRSMFPAAYSGHQTLSQRYANTPPKERRFSYWGSFVRNPWERLHSWWRHERHFERATFEEYVLGGAVEERYSNGARLTRLLVARQEEWVESPSVELDFVGKFEHLQDDFDLLCDLFEKKRRRLPHEHASPHGLAYPYNRDLWTPTMLAVAAPIFEPFALKYGYEEP